MIAGMVVAFQSKEREKAYLAAWFQGLSKEKREKRKAQQRAWARRNRAKCREYCRTYHQKNREKEVQRSADWYGLHGRTAAARLARYEYGLQRAQEEFPDGVFREARVAAFKCRSRWRLQSTAA